VSPLDDLTPDQRAVLQLLLKQGKSYAELAALLKIDPEAVRQRAIGAIAALGPELDEGDRGALTDWLLGQLDDEGRAATRDLLTASPAVARWAQAIGERLRAEGLEPRGELPAGQAETPAATSEPEPEPEPDEPESQADEPEETVDAEARRPEPEAEERDPEPEPAPLPGFAPADGDGARPSRLGGVLLIGGLVVVIVVVALILLGGGGDDGPTTATQTQATAAQETDQTTPTTGELTVEAQVNMRAPGGGDALGVAQIITDGATRGVSVTAEGLEPNGDDDRYALWLTGGPGGKAYLLGFSSTAVGENGRFGGSAELPEDADDYRRIELSRETRNEPRKPTDVVLRGSLES
jgi:hypothetical protein